MSLAAIQDGRAVPITWQDTGALRPALEASGLTEAAFPAYVERTRATNARRVREGDLDHLIFYLLQSTRFTELPPIEPALSAKGLVDSLEQSEREAFLEGGGAAPSKIPASVRARLAALVVALDSPLADARLDYFRALVTAAFPDRRERDNALLDEYLRVMRFVYQKEFMAPRGAAAGTSLRELYRTRGLSTDTAVEAGFLVYFGLGIVKSLEPDRRIRRVLVVGPGMDLAPRTALLEAAPPESYQPWALIDALLALGLAAEDTLEVVAADINPRVVEHLQRARRAPPALTLVTELQESEVITFSDEYRDYFARLGHAVGEPGTSAAVTDSATGHLRKVVQVRPAAARVLHAATLDLVTERLDGPPFDLVIATNLLPYFDDVELMLAMTNVACMLAPDGVFLHNEGRAVLGELTEALGMPFEQARHAVIAHVRGAPAPLFDSVWLHWRRGTGAR